MFITTTIKASTRQIPCLRLPPPPLWHLKSLSRSCLELAAGAIIQPGRRKHGRPASRTGRVPGDAYTRHGGRWMRHAYTSLM